MNDYIVGVYTNHAAKQFSITSRSAANTNLPAMHEAELAKGFTFNVFVEGQTKFFADALKTYLRTHLETAGYVYSSRQRP
jgi:hypothetical protein